MICVDYGKLLHFRSNWYSLPPNRSEAALFYQSAGSYSTKNGSNPLTRELLRVAQVNPIIRWAGSKRALVGVLNSYWTQNRGRYIEPFCGSACLFFGIEPREAILGDINADLIATYRAIRRDPIRVFEGLRRLPLRKSTYDELRRRGASEFSDFENAARFLFLNRLCFNGIYRTNLAGQFNVPYARPKRPVHFELEPLIGASKLLQRTTLIEGDFQLTLSRAERGDFVYMDPPYAISGRRLFSEYHPGTFATHDLERLAATLRALDKKGIKFVVSYADSIEGRALASQWISRRVRTRRNVAGFVSDRKFAYEILATNLESSGCR